VINRLKTAGLVAAHFVDAERLVVVEASEGVRVAIFSVRDGSPLREFSVPIEDRMARADKNAIAVSPGGNLLAIMLCLNLKIYDLQSGEMVGDSRLPEGTEMGFTTCSGLAFSPDGTRLAAAITKGPSARLVCWDMHDGKALVDQVRGTTTMAEIGRAMSTLRGGKQIAWLPDSSTCIVDGTYLFDAQTGAELWRLPAVAKTLLAVDNTHLLIEQPGALAVLTLPVEEIQRAREIAATGGTFSDTRLPKLAKADYSSAQYKDLPAAPVAWSAKFAALPTPEKPLPAPITVSQPGMPLRDVRFSGPPQPTAALLQGQPGTGSGPTARADSARAQLLAMQSGLARPPAASPGRSHIESYDLATGQRRASFDLPAEYRLLDLCGDGTLAILGVVEPLPRATALFRQVDHGWERLDIWALSTGKHALGFRPYAAESDPLDRLTTWCAFIDKRHALTVNAGGRLVKWEFPACKAQYVVEDFGGVLAASADAQYVVGWLPGTDVIRVVRTETGECCGELHANSWIVDVTAAAISADGKRLAAVLHKGTHSLVVWNLGDGTIAHELPVSNVLLKGSRSMLWTGPRYVLAGDRFLIDIEKQTVAWQYALPQGGVFAAGTPDGRCWYCLPASRNSGYQLTAASLPSEQIRQLSAKLELGDQVMFRPGVPVNLSVRVNVAGLDNAEAIIAQHLKAAGVPVDPSAELCLSYRADEQGTGKTLDYYKKLRPTARDKPSDTLQLKQVEITATLAYKDGTEVWKTQSTMSLKERSEYRGSVQELYERELKTLFSRHLRSFCLPRYVFLSANKLGAGRSELGLSGEAAP
jgi:hypothetical protein